MAFFMQQSRVYGGLLVLLLLLGTALRLHQLGTYSLFFDEKSTLLVSQGVPLEGANQEDVFGKTYFTPREFWREKTTPDYFEAMRRSDIGNSPAYYLVFHYWVELVGKSDFAVRLLSVLFSVLTIALAYHFTRYHLHDRRLALLVAGLMAVEPFFIAYSHQARNYSMSFFFTLLLTHVFLLIVRARATHARFALYGFLALICLFCHFLTFTVLLAHGLYVLFFVRDGRIWAGLSAAVALALAGMAGWLTYGGGDYTLYTLDYQAKFYRNIALTNPNLIIGPATWPYVWPKLQPVLFDQFIITNGLASRLAGTRNWILTLGATAFSLGAYVWYQRRPNRLIPGLIGAVNGIALLMMTSNHLAFLTFEVAVFLVVLLVQYARHTVNSERPLLWFFLILTFLPTAVLVVSSYRSGHTAGLTQRYAGFSFPYATILVGMALLAAARLEVWAKVVIFGVLGAQLGWIGTVLGNIYADRSPKYTYFNEPRLPNPHRAAALELIRLYAPGDTILYPNNLKSPFDKEEQKANIQVSRLDAQLVNVYLPKTAEYVQRIDPNEPDRLYLYQRSTGRKKLIFDFEGLKYRY
jgi:4-amino-4-deoxy-L-arabinose transferase-like glycosyltransferase